MDIIKAMQTAEQGKLITNTFMKSCNYFLKYMGNGIFYQYEIINGKQQYKYEVRDFSMSYILDIGWEIVENKWFKDKDHE